jgi:predicted Zn-dependent protease
MEAYFQELANKTFADLTDTEVLLLNIDGEDSDFVRLNRNRIRHAGHVHQQRLHLDLISNQRQSTATIQLSGNLTNDLVQATATLQQLRDQLPLLPKDPYLHYATEPHDTYHTRVNRLPPATDAVTDVIAAAGNLDLVGAWASGEMVHGFANSLGQFNWHSDYSFNFDWSLYLRDDKAVKQNYAGFEWNRNVVEQKLAHARDTLDLLGRKPIRLKPGRYRVFLSPNALYELMQLLNWGGFGLKSHRTAQTPLLPMIKEDVTLHPKVTLVEHQAAGLTPPFTTAGFLKPANVELIASGMYRNCLANRRSAKEYAVAVNCDVEHPQSLELGNGSLRQAEVLGALETGIYISNLWYCNFSDRNHCRITGMTRFACLWVENGAPVAPIDVMRFDESLFNMLGKNLVDLTVEQEHIFDTNTYERRSQSSARLPGVLVDDFTLTL